MAGAKNILIGIFVIIAMAVVIFILLFLHPSVGDNVNILHVRFTDMDKVNIGTRVTYAGLPVGEVVSIAEIPDARTDRIAHNGDVYVYELTLRVDSSVNVYNTDSIVVRTSGLLGERNIEINPLPLKKGQKLVLINNEIIYAETTTSVEDTLKKFSILSDKLEEVLDSIGGAVKDFRETKILDHISLFSQNLADISQSINEDNKLKQTIDNIKTLTERAHNTWDTIDRSVLDLNHLTQRAHLSWTTVDETLFNFREFGDNLNRNWGPIEENLQEASFNILSLTATLKNIIEDTSQGKGTIGGLLVKDDIYLRLKSILNKGETVASDVNRYGLLFHQNKLWQRNNAWRNNLLNRLSTPEKFSLYFKDQMDKVSTSLSKVSITLDESYDCYPNSLIANPEFIQRFADLIRNVEGVDESLKMYNEQIITREQFINQESSMCQ